MLIAPEKYFIRKSYVMSDKKMGSNKLVLTKMPTAANVLPD